MMVAEVVPLPLPGHYTADRKRKWEVHHVDTDTLVPSFCSIGTILPPRPAHSQGRRAQRRSRMARLRATAPAARSVLCVGHVRQLGGESPLCNLMEVKH